MESDSDDNECATLCNKLGECQIVEQQALLDSVELYAGKGAENPVSDGSNRFYMQFHKTGVYDQIKELLYKESKEGDIKIWQPPYSELAIQIVRAFLYMKKGQQIRKYLLRICRQVVSDSIIQLLAKIKKANERKEDIIDEDLEILIKKNNIEEYIYQLLHVLCPNGLICKQQLNIPITLTTINFKEAIFKASFHLSQNTNQKENNSVKQVIIHHQAQFVIKLQREIIIANRKDTLSLNSLSLVSSFYKTIQFPITLYYEYINQQQLCEDITTFPGLIPSLTAFVKFNDNNCIDDEFFIKIREIQLNILKLLYCIFIRCSKETLYHFVCIFKCLDIFDNVIGAGCGLINYNEDIIHQALTTINMLLYKFKDKQFQGLMQQQLFHKVEQQLEEKGNFEEIDSNIFISGQIQWKIKHPSKDIRFYMINVEKDLSNKSEWEL